jgi:RNA-directed DNA polymerase
MVTGLKVSEVLDVDRRYVRNVRAMPHSLEMLGLEGAQTKFEALGNQGNLVAHLLGKVSWLRHIKGASDPVVREIALRFNVCVPGHRIEVNPSLEERRNRAIWIVEHDNAQGTCFFL